MGIEYEWKFQADSDVQKLLLGKIEGSWQEISMETTYYDTHDGALADLHYALRRRIENGRSVCTVKTPTAKGGRGEWEVEESSIEQAIPMLCKLGAPNALISLTHGGVHPICGAKFLRRACQVDIGNAVVELALDQGILTGGDNAFPLCEIEVELKDGSLETAAAFAAHLSKKYALVPEKKSKFRRALELAQKEK